MSSRSVVELTTWSCYSCLVTLSLLCMGQGHRFNLLYLLVRIQLHSRHWEKEKDSFIVYPLGTAWFLWLHYLPDL